ncbi:ROK family transcriptional regulator [Nocardioides sp. YIM 152315]|uniref:ROK family transcriptional regulator n=1 Tax=Nocardioides sp. YIM 152315 TaxID=3031760 RepID=UPI0031F3DEB8
MLEHVVRAGSPTQAEIARQTGLSAATVSNIVRALTEEGLVELTATVSSGRRAQAVRISRSTGLAAGVDFGRSHVRIAIAALSQEIVAEREVRVRRGYPAAEGVAVAREVFDELVESTGATRADVVALGVGIPGPIDTRTGLVGSGSILPEWVGAPLEELVDGSFGMPALIENDANLGALAERTWGAARGVDDLVYIKISTGIGAGLVVDGRLYRGASGTAGEIGHTTVNTMGPVCRCGNRGCLELEAAVPVILERLAASHGADLTIDRVLDLLDAGDVPARRVLDGAGHALGVAVAGLCNLLNPSMIIVGGDLARANTPLLDSMRGVLRQVAVPSAVEHVRLAVSELGARAQVLGALAAVFQSDHNILHLTGELSS